MLDAIYINANCHITGLVDHAVTVADFHAERIKKDYWVKFITLAVVPCPELTVLVYAPFRCLLSCAGNLGSRLTVGMTIAQMDIHLCLQTSVNRCLQQAFDQFAGVICVR